MTIARLHMGLPRLQPREQVDEVMNIVEMRRAIMYGARHSRVIREWLEESVTGCTDLDDWYEVH